LHRVVAETFPEAHRWVSQLRPEHRDEPHGCFSYRLVRQVAEDVAFDRSVNVGDMRASAIVLEVEGSWWHLLAPGTVVLRGSSRGTQHGSTGPAPRLRIRTALLNREPGTSDFEAALIAEGVHPATALGWFTDGLGFATYHPRAR
jgi:hypothetical protein